MISTSSRLVRHDMRIPFAQIINVSVGNHEKHIFSIKKAGKFPAVISSCLKVGAYLKLYLPL